MRGKKLIILIILLILFLIGTSCWDQIEMENRAFVLGIALDQGATPHDFKMTYQIAIPKNMAGGTENKGAGDKGYFNLSGEGPHIFDIDRDIATKLDRTRDLVHLQVVLISEQLAKNGINRILDPFLRFPQTRRRTYVLVTRGEAAKILNIQPAIAPNISMSIAGIIKNNEKQTLKTSAAIDLGRLAENIRRRSDFILAQVIPGKNNVEILGAAVFKEDIMIGRLSERETGAAKLLKGEIPNAPVIIKSPDQQAGFVSVLISKSDIKIRPEVQDNQVTIKMFLELEGEIQGIQNLNFDTLNEKYLKRLGDAIAIHLEKQCQETFKKSQVEFKADIFGYGRLVNNYHHRFWLDNKDKWDQIYQEAKLDLKITVAMRRTGLIR